ncbi:MAG TPA: aminoglycoside phosphotransferase family protein [Parachlamydiaceae bacterium]|nr:aminoglycoside phosphotransferase family protein [Parachlamydiaceae bacterium]
MNDQIILYQQHLNLHAATFSRIEHADAMVAVVYKITQPDGKQFILKICDRINDYLREVHFLKLFAGKLPVPQIIEVVQPDDHIHGAILMECLPGSLLQSKELSESLAYEIGSCLAGIHLMRLYGYGDPLQDHLNSEPRAYFTLKFEEGLDECNEHLPLSLIEKCHRYYNSHLDLLMSVDGPCVAHRDFRPGNLIVQDGKLQGIIDWAGARASFAEEDFCSLEHGEWSNNPLSKKSFLDGYASVRPIPDYNHLISLLRLNKAIATIGFTVKRGTWKTNNAGVYQFNRSFLERLFAGGAGDE